MKISNIIMTTRLNVVKIRFVRTKWWQWTTCGLTDLLSICIYTILRLALHAETSDLPTGVEFVLSKMRRLDVDVEFKEIYEGYVQSYRKLCSIMLYIEDCIEGK